MKLKFPLFARVGRAAASGVQSSDFVVARPVSSAPSAWVFFDGTETEGHGNGKAAASLPGIVFFVDEAWSCPDMREAQVQATRLNAQAAAEAGPGAVSEPWVAIAVQRVIAALAPVASDASGPSSRGGLLW